MRGKSAARIVSAVILWTIGISLIILIAFPNQNKTEIVDISGIKSDKIVAGYNIVAEAEELNQMGFAGRSYDMIMVGFASEGSSELTYLGLSTGKYYRSTETISNGLLQRIKSVEVKGQRLIIEYVKDMAIVMLLSLFLFVILGAIGLIIVIL